MQLGCNIETNWSMLLFTRIAVPIDSWALNCQNKIKLIECGNELHQIKRKSKSAFIVYLIFSPWNDRKSWLLFLLELHRIYLFISIHPNESNGVNLFVERNFLIDILCLYTQTEVFLEIGEFHSFRLKFNLFLEINKRLSRIHCL